jgi:transcriptional regulator
MYGRVRLIEDKDELYHLLKDLVDTQEEGTPEGQRYRLESMPKDLLESMMNALVGFALTVVKTECAAKLSQNRNTKDYETIISKLTERGDPRSCEVAELMKSRRNSLQGK